MIIEIDRSVFGEPGGGTLELVLDKLLPGQCIGASAWFDYAKALLQEGGMTNFVKEPTLFKHTDADNQTGLIMHADDGMLASTPKEREKLVGVLISKVKLQVSEPLRNVGDEVEFLKRRYVMVPGGVAVYSNTKYLSALLKTCGDKVRNRDAPADASFLEPDTSKELGPADAKVYRESVGRLLYLGSCQIQGPFLGTLNNRCRIIIGTQKGTIILTTTHLGHTRPDVQFAICILSGKMQSPTTASMKMLIRVVSYLASVPEIGFVIKPFWLRRQAPLGGGRNFGGGKCQTVTGQAAARREKAEAQFSCMLQAASFPQWSGHRDRSL